MMKALGTDIGTIHFVGIGGIGMILRRTQNGYVRSYALSLLGGALRQRGGDPPAPRH